MNWWDKQMKSRLMRENITLQIYKRFVDDINIAASNDSKQITQTDEKGNGYKEEEQHTNSEERNRKENEEKMMNKIKDIGNSIHESIQLEVDYPSLHEDNKLPLLDIKIWIEKEGDHQEERQEHREEGEKEGDTEETDLKKVFRKKGKKKKTKILHEFYQKEVASKSTINARSAMSWKDKRTIITQEILRILLRCSPELPWKSTLSHVNQYMDRLQYSGYKRKFRKEVWRSAIKAYKEIKAKDARKETPMYRKKTWKRKERERNKRTKKTGWYKRGGYKSIIFVPATPSSALKKRYEKILKESELGIKVVERSGTKLKHLLQRNNPFEKRKCNRENECFICTTGTGDCKKGGVTYRIECSECECVYVGETARTGHYRGKQHQKLLHNKQKESVLYKHVQEQHNDQVAPTFRMKITGKYKTALERQISEAIQIENVPAYKRLNTKEEWGHSKIITSIRMT